MLLLVLGPCCGSSVVTVCAVTDSYEEDPDAPGERRLCSSTILPPLVISVTEEELRLLRCVFAHIQYNKLKGLYFTHNELYIRLGDMLFCAFHVLKPSLVHLT